jgi:hypothetical protein
MQNRARTYRVAFLSAALAAAVGACGSPAGLARFGATFALRRVGTQELPAVLSHTAGGRLVEVVSGALTFETLVERGTVTGYAEVRITDPGAAPRVERGEISGSSIRGGDGLEVRYATGARETFAIEGPGSVLRTVAASCAPDAACLDILRVYRYERIAAATEP